MTAGSPDRASTLPPPAPDAFRSPAREPLLRVLPGTPASASAARLMARQLLGDGDPAVETVMLLVSELVTNAIVHSRSGAPGGTVTVALCPVSAGVLVQVRDDGGPSEPCLAHMGTDGAEHGYGLLLVDALADSWGTISGPDSRVTWCRVSRSAPATTGSLIVADPEGL
jgi:anti-sigma regulatory factor (Ser/Thr protein kinase)